MRQNEPTENIKIVNEKYKICFIIIYLKNKNTFVLKYMIN